MCRQYVLSRATSGTTSGTTVTSITSIFGTGNTIGAHEDCANDVHICRWCADDMWMTSVSADDMQMTPGVVLHEIGQLREVCRWHADDMCVQMTCRWCADDMWMVCGWHVCLRMMCGWPTDDTRCSTAWNWATQASVWTTSGWHMSSAGEILPEISLSCHPHIICTSSARRPHKTSTPKIFPVKYQSNSSAKNGKKPIIKQQPVSSSN